MYRCQECLRAFKTARSAEKAAYNGCPNCGGVDIDIDTRPEPISNIVLARNIAKAKKDKKAGQSGNGSK